MVQTEIEKCKNSTTSLGTKVGFSDDEIEALIKMKYSWPSKYIDIDEIDEPKSRIKI
jgi:hypothetical protein